jgi:hypothetical protein
MSGQRKCRSPLRSVCAPVCRPLPWSRIDVWSGRLAGLLSLAVQLGLGMPRRLADQLLLPVER